MAGAQFKQNHCEIVKPTMRYHTTETVGYSERRICVKRYTFTHDSILSTIVPERSSTAPGPHDGRPREDTL